MSASAFASTDLPVRPDLSAAHDAAWAAVAAPGTWLNGTQRVAVAAEVRHARDCPLCLALHDALSPNAVKGEHATRGALAPAAAELVHRLTNDPGRLSQAWADAVIARGVSEGEYVEIAGLVAMVMMMDTCTRAMGLPERALPQPAAGEPTRYRPPGARREAAWLPIVEPPDAVAADGPMYPSPKAGYIYRALSSVPQSLRDYWSLANAHYLAGPAIYAFDRVPERAISRPQIEVLAARTSALHQCVY
jgi:hypothetical protein